MQQINPSTAWRKKAADAEQAVRDGSKKPNDFGDVWAALKPELSKLSHGKCWYCESRQSRSDNAVDHFRPKSEYPWYAFSYENYRFSCSFCNSLHRNPITGKSQGKGSLFPLFEDNQQAKNETELDLERPILLDPCKATDPGLLDFLADGMPCPRNAADPIFVRRVRESIRSYNLDHPDLVEQRRVLALRIKGWIKAAHALYPKFLQGNQDAREAFDVLVGDIGRSIDDRAELSVFARCIVASHRAKPWVEPILDT